MSFLIYFSLTSPPCVCIHLIEVRNPNNSGKSAMISREGYSGFPAYSRMRTISLPIWGAAIIYLRTVRYCYFPENSRRSDRFRLTLHVAIQTGLYHSASMRTWRVVSEDSRRLSRISLFVYFRLPPSFISSLISRIFSIPFIERCSFFSMIATI